MNNFQEFLNSQAYREMAEMSNKMHAVAYQYEEQKRMLIKINIRGKFNELENKENRRITIKEFAQLTACSRTAIQNYLSGNPRRIDLNNVSKIMYLFRSRGLECEVNDLFEVNDFLGTRRA